ncbi:MAG TPA: hypothetical protein PKK70_03530 [Candidatus Paceibacterota bacterium]|nr:hypothetical protein [Candidatus Paceibacterota bacterium]
MELILSEWLGVDGIVKLTDERLDLLYSNYCFDEWKRTGQKQDSELFKKIKKNEYNILSKNEIEMKKYFSNSFKESIQLLKFEHFIPQLIQINDTHVENLKKENIRNINPICKIFQYNGEYCVSTFQYVGEFELKSGANTLKIKILPRDLVNDEGFKLMVETVFNISSIGDISGVRSENSFLLLYYLAFIKRVKEVLKRGVYREYVEKEENLSYLKERLIIPEHIRQNYFNKHKLFCNYTEFSPENLINQIIIGTLTHIGKSKFSGNHLLMKGIKEIKNVFEDFEQEKALKPTIAKIELIKYNRQNQRYKEIMIFCKNIIQNQSGSFGSGDTKYSAFYLDMNLLFEQFVGKLLQDQKLDELINKDNKCKLRNSNNWNVELQNDSICLDKEGILGIKPDILIKNHSEYIAVADTKYKRLNTNEFLNFGISNNDIYQVMAYAQKFKTNSMYLVYPKPKDLNWKLPYKIFNIDNKKLIVYTVDLNK